MQHLLYLRIASAVTNCIFLENISLEISVSSTSVFNFPAHRFNEENYNRTIPTRYICQEEDQFYRSVVQYIFRITLQSVNQKMYQLKTININYKNIKCHPTSLFWISYQGCRFSFQIGLQKFSVGQFFCSARPYNQIGNVIARC